MNWHVLVIMQSFISHRFLFIGKRRKIPEELTESFNHNRFLFNMARSGRWIFSHICALMACFHLPGAVVQKKTEDSGSAPWRVGPPSIHGVGPGGRGPGGNRPVPSGASRSGPCLMQQALGRPRKEILFAPECISSSELDADASGLQWAAELSSVTSKSHPCCLNTSISGNGFPSSLG